ncbi:MAG: AzlC family ABC transporter permease [Acinetobacter sp.]
MLRLNQIQDSLLDAAPVMAGYYVVAFVFGVMCLNIGLPVWFPAAMCLFVYAGAAQFSSLSLLTAGTTLAPILLSTLLINARHILMSMYMSKKLRSVQMSRLQKSLYAFGLTDESFAMHSQRLENGLLTTSPYLLRFNIFCHLAWIAGGLCGAIASEYLARFIRFKLDYALTAMMVFVLVSLCNTPKKRLVALISIITTIGMNFIHISPLNVFVATAVGCGVGLCIKKPSL